MITIKQLHYRYPTSENGIIDIDLDIATGQLLAVLGQSGSGKTTLLNLIAGFLPPDSGDILLFGKSVKALPAAQRQLGIVFQHYALFPHMTVLDNIAYPLKLRRMTKTKRREKAQAIAEKMGLATQIGQYPHSISGGQQQRVALARALVFEPKALLLDEPLSALDAGLRISMREEIRAIQQQFGITAILITHDQEEAMSMADQVAVLQAGRLLQVDSPKTLYEQPNSKAVAEFIGRANFLPATVLAPQQIQTPIGTLQANTNGMAVGSAVTAMIRPEYLTVGNSDDNCFSARYASLKFLGASSQAKLEVNGQTLLIEGQLPDHITQVGIAARHIHLLSNET